MLRFIIEKIKLGCNRKKVATSDVEDDIKTAIEPVEVGIESIVDKVTEKKVFESTKQLESVDRPDVFPWLNLPYVPRRRILDFCPPAYWHVFGQLSHADNLMVEKMVRRTNFDLTKIEFRLVNCTKTHQLATFDADGYMVIRSRQKFLTVYEMRTQPTFTIENAAEFIKYWMKLKNIELLYFFADILSEDVLRMLKLVRPKKLGAFGKESQQMSEESQENILSLIEFNFITQVRFSCIDESFVLTLIKKWEEGAYPKLEYTMLAVDETLIDNLDEVKRLYPCYIQSEPEQDAFFVEVFSYIYSNARAAFFIDKQSMRLKAYRNEVV